MFGLCMKPMVKRGALALLLLALIGLAPLSLHAQKKKKQPETPAPAPVQKEDIPDFTKIVFPFEPAVPRVRYLDYFASSLPDFGTDKKQEQKKQRWMDRLAGVDPNAGTQKAPKTRYALYAPYGVAVDSKGLLYVADNKVGAVFMFNTETDDVQLIRNGMEAHFKSILGLAIDDADHLFVSDNALHVVEEFDANHKYLGSFGNDVLRGPCGIAIDLENRYLYVVDTDLDQVIVFDADTRNVIRKIGTTGKNHTLTDPGEFSKPTNAAIDSDGNLYVTDTLNDRVEIFDADGNFIRAWGKNGDGPGNFGRPKGIAIDADGHVWVADALLNRMQIFTPEGQLLLAFGNFGIMPGQFQSLTGLTIDKSNRVFAAEQLLGRIQMFRYYTDAEAKAELEKRKAGGATKKESANAQPAGSSSATPAATPAAVGSAANAQTNPKPEKP
jgi:DNA-binding beta-propeller fold protein YncE